jgi:hypothetical protein
MSNANRNLLADREVMIQVDELRLSAPIELKLAAVRISPQLAVLTEVSTVFVDEEVVPRITRHLEHVGKVGCSLYLPGEGVARPIERLVAKVVTNPLVEELEQFLEELAQFNNNRSSVAVGKRTKTSVHLIVRTQPDESVPCFVPVHPDTDDNLERQPGKRQSAGKPAPPVRGSDSAEFELRVESEAPCAACQPHS